MLPRLPERPSASRAAEDAIRRAILDGTYPPGSLLPPERELAAGLGISRLTLRAALAAVAGAGLVAVRHGSGYTVRDPRDGSGALLPSVVELADQRGALAAAAADLLRLRRHLAAAVLDAIVARPPTAAQRRAIVAAIERFAALVRDDDAPDLAALADADLAITRALLDAAGSMVLHLAIAPIAALVVRQPALRAALYAEPATNLAGWRALDAWLDAPSVRAIAALVDALAEHDRQTLARLGSGRRTRRGKRGAS